MAIQTIHASNRRYRVTPAVASQQGFPFLEIGPAGLPRVASFFVVQFAPSIGFDGQFVVEGHVMGDAAQDMGPPNSTVDVPFGPIPYRRIMLNNIAQVRELVTDPITTSALIEIPASGLTVALQIAPPSGGFCDILIWDLQGTSTL